MKRKACTQTSNRLGPAIDLSQDEPLRTFRLPSGVLSSKAKTELLEHYKQYQVLLVRGGAGSYTRAGECPLRALRTIWSEATKEARACLAKSWTVENVGGCSDSPDRLKPDVLLGKPSSAPNASFYVSCIAQNDSSLVSSVATGLFDSPSCLFDGSTQSDPIWLFVGRNCDEKLPMIGRPEHTDVVSHSGTWHAQLAGTKRWYLRPAEDCPEWAGLAPRLLSGGAKRTKRSSKDDLADRLCLECGPGDVLLINTRLWKHHTHLPAKTALSFSLAKDFFLVNSGDSSSGPEEFTNIEAVYAVKACKKGSIVLRESELPGCSLPRSLQANCEVATLEDEEGNEEFCLIARCNIKAGDYLAVPPSDSEEEEEEEDEEEKEEEEESF